MRLLSCLSYASSLLIVVVRAQNHFIDTHNISSTLQDFPSCAQLCIIPVLSKLTGDISTLANLAQQLCPNEPIQASISGCVQKNCTANGQAATSTTTQALCEGFYIRGKSHYILTAVVCVTAMTVPFVVLRIFSRVTVAGKLWWDDGATLIAAVCVLGIMILEVLMSLNGWGNHIWTVDVTRLPTTLKYFYATQMLYIVAQCFTKVSILLFYLRIFPQKWFVNCTIAMMCLIITSETIYLLLIAFQCTPIASFWDKSLNAKCVNQIAIIYSGAGFAIFEHVMMILLPIPCIRALNITKGKRLSLFAMFSVGTFALVAALVRLNFVGRFGTSTDATFDNGPVELWSCTELSIALICACLPALRPLLTRYIPFLFGNTQRNYVVYEDRERSAGGYGLGSSNQKNTPQPTIINVEKSFSFHNGDTDNRSKSSNDRADEFHRRHQLDKKSLHDIGSSAQTQPSGDKGEALTPGRSSGHSSQGSVVELVTLRPKSELKLETKTVISHGVSHAR